MKAATIDSSSSETPRARFVGDLLELVKARLTLLVLLTTAVGFYLGAEGPISWTALVHTVLGTAAAAAGAAALNQWWEYKLDAMMHRTRSRPVPAGRMRPTEAVVIGSALSIFGVTYLAFVCNALSAVLAAITIIVYIFAYTPLKLVSTFNTALGAVPGALPPMIGWAAARGTLNAGAWMLFAILFFWQLPHFFAIAWMYRDDYARAGFVMLPTIDPEGFRTGRQAVTHTFGLVFMSLLPVVLGLAGAVYFAGAALLGGLFLFCAFRFSLDLTLARARGLFLTSIVYLPLLLILMVLDKVKH